MTVIARFAPSPTGKLHVGNARTALVTWLFTRANKGQFILRIDDTDQERSEAEYTQAIKHDLTWLGLDWDRNEHQSGRMDVYQEALDKLKADGRLYPCYETEQELSLKRKSQLNQGLPPIYDRAALKLTDEQITKYEEAGRKPHWRFKLEHKPIVWEDRVRGRVEFSGSDMSDPVLVRADGTPLYHICSVIDDIEYGITDVIRGEDHVSNTAAHIQMFEALGADVPNFAHIALLTASDGSKLSKRTGSFSVEELRDDLNVEAMAVNNVLARLGTADPITAEESLEALTNGFDFNKFSRAAAKFNVDEIKRVNAMLLHKSSFASVKDELAEMGLDGIDEAFWNIARANIESLKDIQLWWDVTHGPVTPQIEADDEDFVHQAAELLPKSPWGKETWTEWYNAIKKNTDRKGKSLFMPLRKALTGLEHGPELGDLMQLIGPERTKKRLTASAQQSAA